MSVIEIITVWLKANGYDGLCGEECGCFLGDLMPCEEFCADCKPGKATVATEADCDTWFDGEVGDRIIKEGKANG